MASASDTESSCSDSELTTEPSQAMLIFCDLDEGLFIVPLDLQRTDRGTRKFSNRLVAMIEHLKDIPETDYLEMLVADYPSIPRFVIPTLARTIWMVNYHPDLQTEENTPLQWRLLLHVLSTLKHLCHLKNQLEMPNVVANVQGQGHTPAKSKKLKLNIGNVKLHAALQSNHCLPALLCAYHCILARHTTFPDRLSGLALYIETFNRILATMNGTSADVLEQLLHEPPPSVLPKEYRPFVFEEDWPDQPLLNVLLQCTLETRWETTPSIAHACGLLKILLQLPHAPDHLILLGHNAHEQTSSSAPQHAAASTTDIDTGGHQAPASEGSGPSERARMDAFRNQVRTTAQRHAVLNTLEQWWDTVSHNFSRKRCVNDAAVDPYLMHTERLITCLWLLCENNPETAQQVFQHQGLLYHIGEGVTRSLDTSSILLFNTAEELIHTLEACVRDHHMDGPEWAAAARPSSTAQQLWLQHRICLVLRNFAELLKQRDRREVLEEGERPDGRLGESWRDQEGVAG